MSDNVSSSSHIDFFIKRAQFYREENLIIKEILNRLKLLTEDQTIPVNLMENAIKIKEHIINIESKSKEESKRKQNYYLAQLKSCTKTTIDINNGLVEEINIAKRECEDSKRKIAAMSNRSDEEMKQLEEKPKLYENEIAKFEKKYPFLNNPSLDLMNISKECEKLRILKETKEKLKEELDHYQGLKPDIGEASQQLNNLKEKHKQVSSELLE